MDGTGFEVSFEFFSCVYRDFVLFYQPKKRFNYPTNTIHKHFSMAGLVISATQAVPTYKGLSFNILTAKIFRIILNGKTLLYSGLFWKF